MGIEFSQNLAANTKRIVAKQRYEQLFLDERWIKKLKHNSRDAGNVTRWETSFQEGFPAFVINPKIGTCMIWSKMVLRQAASGDDVIYFLVTPIRPVVAVAPAPVAEMIGADVDASGPPSRRKKKADDDEDEEEEKSEDEEDEDMKAFDPAIAGNYATGAGVSRQFPLSPGETGDAAATSSSGRGGRMRRSRRRRPLKIVEGEFYEVPATLTLPNGNVVNYIVALQVIIMKIFTPDGSLDGVTLVQIKRKVGIEIMTLKKFVEVMKASPPEEDTVSFSEAYAALYNTNPELVAKYQFSSQITVTPDARPYLLSATFNGSPMTIGAPIYHDYPASHTFHPEWYSPKELSHPFV
ncbi:MAG: hypothetical protein Q8M03_08420 [Legionella sp.]|nr:hypothetical protein [Legionella sp.]